MCVFVLKIIIVTVLCIYMLKKSMVNISVSSVKNVLTMSGVEILRTFIINLSSNRAWMQKLIHNDNKGKKN